MNLVAAAPLWLVVVLALAMIAAAIEDATRLRISNVTTLIVLADALVAAVLVGPSWDLWQNLAVFALILALGTLAFSAGWLGGGDVKLFAAAGLWLDLRTAVWLIALVFIAGGVIAVCFLLARIRRKPGTRKSKGVPYGIAIAVGTLAMISLDARALRHDVRPLPPVNIAPRHF